jgi:hypothetical protein
MGDSCASLHILLAENEPDDDALLTFKFESFTRWALFSPWFLFNDVCQKKWDIVGKIHA